MDQVLALRRRLKSQLEREVIYRRWHTGSRRADDRGHCPAWKTTKASQTQRLSRHRKGEEELSQQSVETHVQRPKRGGLVPLEERNALSLTSSSEGGEQVGGEGPDPTAPCALR